ncbi:Beta-galactosidase C-terminal domain [Streptomyces sp. NPDC058307]|uniref:Beta-galactosidase C-terminal domain n=1 Tax=Streptomyces sp. NPDC058307 TaxID=3346439 RepID=UPI0036E48F86
MVHEGLETATGVSADGTRLLFILNHADAPARLKAHTTAIDLLTGNRRRRTPHSLSTAGASPSCARQ